MLDHHHPSGGFRNPWPNAAITAELGGLLRWRLDRLRHPPPPDPDASAFPLVQPSFHQPRAQEDLLTITWVGHATFLIQLGGLNVLTDPIWTDHASPVPGVGPKRRVPPGIRFDDLPPIDLVLQSHDHYNHLDDRTVCWLEARNPGARWLVPLGLTAFYRRRGVHEITELDWWQEASHDPLTIGCTPAQHFSGRTPWGRNRSLWCGWSVQTTARRVFFAGDTGAHPVFGDIARRFGPFDVALIPIGAYDPRWFMRPVHMDPEEAVQAACDLGAPRFIPMHWGTFKLTDEPLDEPPQRARSAWVSAGLPLEKYCQLAHGETFVLETSDIRPQTSDVV
ncbi:MAG TPA: MBL fold metallo-hydrolase [Gemmatimonadales bacterium]|nr:MBL fold metallo-hydrolase [Gemmatimonadales bacterium]